jgi:crossover junction endodeoxyribonuclease RusA
MIRLELKYPPSINHYFSYYQGRPVLSKDARSYRHAVRRLAIAQGIKPMLGELAMQVDAFPPDNRRRDIDNCLKSLIDALQHAGAFWDDSQIVDLHAIKHPPMKGGQVIVAISQTKDTLCQESL